jgi:hypothetical protein
MSKDRVARISLAVALLVAPVAREVLSLGRGRFFAGYQIIAPAL